MRGCTVRQADLSGESVLKWAVARLMWSYQAGPFLLAPDNRLRNRLFPFRPAGGPGFAETRSLVGFR